MFYFELNGRQLRIRLVDESEGVYQDAAALSRHVYWESYRATIAPRPSKFVVCENMEGKQMLACAGITFGSAGPLFSEQYLDAPLAQLLAPLYNSPISRGEIAEISALATLEPSIGTELVRAIPIICWFLGMSGLLCTVTTKLRRGFEHLKLPFYPIATPDPSRLAPVPGVQWGTYYDMKPVTGLIRLDNIGHIFETYCGRYRPVPLAAASDGVAAAVAQPEGVAV